jgi:hypothetical protein
MTLGEKQSSKEYTSFTGKGGSSQKQKLKATSALAQGFFKV